MYNLVRVPTHTQDAVSTHGISNLKLLMATELADITPLTIDMMMMMEAGFILSNKICK